MNALKTTNKFIKALAKGIALSLILSSTTAIAAIPVIDYASIAQAIITSSNTTKELMATYEEMRLNYMKLQGVVADVKDIEGEIRKLTRLEDAMNELQGSLGDAKSIMDDRYKRYAASNTATWEEYMEMEKERYDRGYKTTRANYQREREIMDNVKDDYSKVKKMQGQITTLQGPLEAQQLLNSQINLLLTQNTKMMESMAARNAESDVEKQDVRASKEAHMKAVEERNKNYLKYREHDYYR